MVARSPDGERRLNFRSTLNGALAHRAVSQAWVSWVALLAVGGASGCDTAFSPAQPVVGSIVYEWQAPVPSAGVHVQLLGLDIDVPPGAVPDGTTLTMRLVGGVTKANPPGWTLSPFTAQALQILPESVVFARPLVYKTLGAFAVIVPGFAGAPVEHLFTGQASDASWTWSADADSLDPGGGGTITFALDRPGLWIKGNVSTQLRTGSYHLTGLSCSSGATATPAGVYLVVAGDAYTLTSALAPPCRDDGTLAMGVGSYTLTTGPRALGFDAQAEGTRLRLKTTGAFQGFCSAQESLIFLFDFKGCATDADCGAGGTCDGQLCAPASTMSTTSCLTDVVGVTGGK